MEVVAAIILFIAVCVALMFWDFYKPARFRTTYRNINEKRRDSGGDSGGGCAGSGSGGWFDGGSGDGGGGD